MSSDLANTYNSVILSVAKNLKVSKRFQSRTDLKTLHVVQGDTIARSSYAIFRNDVFINRQKEHGSTAGIH